MLTTRQHAVLKQMAEAHLKDEFEEAEIVAEGISVYLGYERISIKTVKALLDHCAISEEGDGGDYKFHRYTINCIGLLLVRKPEMDDAIWLKLRSNTPFTLKGDEIVDLEPLRPKRKKRKT